MTAPPAYPFRPPPPKPVPKPTPTSRGDSPNFQPGTTPHHVVTTHDAHSGITSYHVVPTAPVPRPNAPGRPKPAKAAPPPPARRPPAIQTKKAPKPTQTRHGGPNPTPVPSHNGAGSPGAMPKVHQQSTSSSLPGLLTPAQISAMVNNELSLEMDAETQPFKYQQTQNTQTGINQANTVAGFQKAAAGLVSDTGQTVSNIYQDAAKNQAGIAGGFTGALRDAATADAAKQQDFLTNVVHDTPTGAASITGDPANLSNALYFQGGYVPSGRLSDTGAALGGALAQLPVTEHNLGLQAIGKIQADTRANAMTIAQQMAQVVAREPALRQQLLAQYNDANLKNASFQLAAQAAGFNQGATTARLKIEGYNATTGRIRTQNAQTAAARKVNPTLSKAYGVQVNSNGEVIAGKNGKPIVYPGSTQKVDMQLSKAYGVLMDNTGTPITHGGKLIPLPKSKGSFTATQVQHYHGEAATIAQNAFNGFTDPKGVVHPKLSLGGAMQEMRKSGVPDRIARVELARWYNAAERKRLQGK